ncbi:MAG: hypothetical protein QW614_00895 [Candidatus Caldarchaeum sp.]|uniref:Uncharacterized protein n=1 Tax=Caldiarchaeum subterraneum TaxID=311458 RepID=A0A7C5LDQ4_CALS0
MPKKIVLKIRPADKAVETPEVEALPAAQEVETSVVKAEPLREAVQPQPTQQTQAFQPAQPQQEGVELDQALQLYEELMKEIERLKNLDKNFIAYCLKHEDLRPQTIRSILSRMTEKRKEVLVRAEGVLEKLKSARDALGAEFAETEEELIWSSLELNTMQLEGEKSSEKNVGLKEELEARIPELRRKLTNLRNRLKTVDDMVKRLSDLPRTIAEMTSNKEEVSKLFEEVKKRYLLTHGPKGESVLRAEIERIAQQEAIPREYATLLLWRSVVSR